MYWLLYCYIVCGSNAARPQEQLESTWLPCSSSQKG